MTRPSEIFDEYAKIALKNGLISKAEESSAKKLENNPRADSLSISDIEALYGVKTNKEKDQEYEKNIFERAHPNSVMVAPSYDKLMGAVQTPNEKQNSAINIINRNPSGNHTQHKYAERDLLLSLIRTANYMDHSDNDELRVLADTCIDQLESKKKLKKEAIAPALVVAPILAGLGLVWWQQHNGLLTVEGYLKDLNTLILKLNDMITADTTLGFGEKFEQGFVTKLSAIKDTLSNLYEQTYNYQQLIDNAELPVSKEEVISERSDPTRLEAANGLQNLNKMMPSINKILSELDDHLKSTSWQELKIKEKGMFTSMIDSMQFLHGNNGLFTNKFDAVHYAIVNFKKSADELTKKLQEFSVSKKRRDEKITNDLNKKMEGKSKPSSEEDDFNSHLVKNFTNK